MDTWGNSSSLDNLNTSLPSYETMIVESLQNVGRTRGAAPKEIFNYMIEHWPLIPNFRQSASQALARALKRGRLLKEGTLYSLNPAWTSGHTTPNSTQPARHIAKKPASIFSPRPPPPMEQIAANEGDNTEASLGTTTQFAPDTKAVAQAIVSLLHPMTSDIKDLADAQRHGSTDNTSDSATDSGEAYDPNENVILTGFMGDSTIPNRCREQRHSLSPARRSSPQDLGWSSSEVIPVDDSEELSREKLQQRLLRSLEGISAQLHDRYGT